jgi:hypothetical protein
LFPSLSHVLDEDEEDPPQSKSADTEDHENNLLPKLDEGPQEENLIQQQQGEDSTAPSNPHQNDVIDETPISFRRSRRIVQPVQRYGFPPPANKNQSEGGDVR